jgi:hypothetical protein
MLFMSQAALLLLIACCVALLCILIAYRQFLGRSKQISDVAFATPLRSLCEILHAMLNSITKR